MLSVYVRLRAYNLVALFIRYDTAYRPIVTADIRGDDEVKIGLIEDLSALGIPKLRKRLVYLGVSDVVGPAPGIGKRAFSRRFYGKVSKDLADQYYDAADIQIILANRDKEIVSSKIFESVASGYPIVYFYFSEDEKSYQLLKKYPLVYFTRQDQIDERECEQIREWMHNNKGKRIEFDSVREAYADATPDLIVDTTIKVIG